VTASCDSLTRGSGATPADKEAKTIIIACATVIEEILPLLPPFMGHRVLDFGLHTNPAHLRQALQDAIDEASKVAATVVLGYGLCSQGVVGLRATECTLVVPRVDDCIAIFLGSASIYREQVTSEPGTYFLTKGWIEAGDSPFAEHERLKERYGEIRARRMTDLVLKNYTRLALINTGLYELDRYRDYARLTAQVFGLRYQEIKGSTDLVKRMIFGPWDEGFVVARPGDVLGLEAFLEGLWQNTADRHE
jgi:hypothetical protein